MKEQLIEFETAKLAKEKGFECSITDDTSFFLESLINDEWIRTGFSTNHFFSREKYDPKFKRFTIAPTQSLLQKWLRDEHDIDVYIIPNGMRDKGINDRLYHPQLWVKDLYQTELHSKKTYEQALEQGLINGLKLIK